MTVERTEYLVPGPAEALAGLLGTGLPDLPAGEPLPLLWHWVYLLDRPARADQGADGHPRTGSRRRRARGCGGCSPVGG